jgi:hypothetical protein
MTGRKMGFSKFTVSVLPSLTQFGEIGSLYPGFAIIVAIGLRNPMLNQNQAQILYCRMFIDLFDDVVAVTDEQEQFLVNRIKILFFVGS